MLDEAMLAEVLEAVRAVACAGWGQVAIVIEHGRPVRLQQQTDMKFKRSSS